MRWQIKGEHLSQGGFAPAWYKETYPSFGNKNQAGSMTNIDATNPGYITQGPGLANLTNGSQAAAVTTLIKGIVDWAVTSNATYGTGGNKLYQITSTAVTNAGIWPHTISSAGAELGEDVAYYQGNLYYSFNETGAGEVGKWDLNVTFTDNWGSTVPTGKAALVAAVPHPMIVGGDDVMYIGNGRYVAEYNGTTAVFNDKTLTLPVGTVVQDIAWNSDRLWIAGVNPNLSGSNKNKASIYIWNGTDTSWELEIRVMGFISALHVKNGILFVIYQDITSTGGYKLGYVNGNTITDLANFSGGLPSFYQITDYKDFIIWNSAGSIYAYGSGDKNMPVRLFQLASAGYSNNGGGLVCPFGTPISASHDSGSNYKIAQFSGYDTNSNWKSLMFDVTATGRVPKIDFVRINFETLLTGARVDWKLLDNQGRTIYSDIISFVKASSNASPNQTLTSVYAPLNGLSRENFRIEFDYANGSTSNPVNIKNWTIDGSTN